MKTAEQINPNYAPVYVAMYPDLAKIFQKHGYALAVHGSVCRDFDLIAFPWIEKPSTHEEALTEVIKTFSVTTDWLPAWRPNGRTAYTLNCGFGNCAFDISFFTVGLS